MSEPKISNNRIVYDFGSEFKLIQIIKGCKKEVTLLITPEEGVFWGLFDESDADFEIDVNNSRNESDILYRIKIREESSNFCFITPASKRATLKALENNGRHLHFISQATDDGKTLVAENAMQNKISYDKSSMYCSRISFDVEVERTPEEYEEAQRMMIEERRRKHQVEIEKRKLKQNPIDIRIKTLTGKTIKLDIFSTDCIADVKEIIKNETDIPTHVQRLIYGGKQLEDCIQITDYNIQNGSTLHLIERLRGGKSYFENGPASDAVDDFNDSVRGVICFSKKTNQEFGCYRKEFVASEKIKAKPFTIELRVRSKYSLK